MHGLVAILDEYCYEEVEKIWDELELKFNLKDVRITPFPHFSWHVAENYDFDLLEKKMELVAKTLKPFKVKTTGLGIFSGERLVLYIPVVKNEELMKIHIKIWDNFNDISQGSWNEYHPDNWMPHITLAYGDLTEKNIGEVMNYLSFKNFTWEMTINNLSFIFTPTGDIGELRFKKIF